MKNNIYKTRKEQGISQQELANRSNISCSMLSGYETGRHEPTEEVWEKLAKGLNVSLPYLHGYVDREVDMKVVTKIIKLLFCFMDSEVTIKLDGVAISPMTKTLYTLTLLIALMKELGIDTDKTIKDLENKTHKPLFIRTINSLNIDQKVSEDNNLFDLYDKLEIE